MATKRIIPGTRSYAHPAGGWGTLRATAKAVREQTDESEAPMLLLRTNKPDGLDCPARRSRLELNTIGSD
jgi:hypothetical protein